MTEPENTAAAPAMSRPAEDHLVDYESFNIFALAGLLLGIASVASLIDQLFWLIPAAGTLMSLYALWMFSHSDRNQVGRPLAVVGLCLSLFFLCAAPTAAYVERQYIRAESRAYADRWFEYLKNGDREAAYDMTLSFSSREFRDDAQNLPNRNKNNKSGDNNIDPIATYYEQHRAPRELAEARENATVEYVGVIYQSFDHNQYHTILGYDIRKSKQSIAEHYHLRLEREKDFSANKWHWRIVDLKREDERS